MSLRVDKIEHNGKGVDRINNRVDSGTNSIRRSLYNFLMLYSKRLSLYHPYRLHPLIVV